MKASSVGVEFDIVLNFEEISRLEREVLNGKIKTQDKDKRSIERPFMLKIDETPKDSPFAYIKFLPYNSNYFEWKGFVFVVSKEGYLELKEQGFCGDRIGFSGCKLSVYSEDYLKKR